MPDSYFHIVCIFYTWGKDNMCADFVACKGCRLDAKVIWYEIFPKQLVELTMKDVFGFRYEIM